MRRAMCVVLMAVSGAGSAGFATGAARADELTAGFARVDLTPEGPVPLAGPTARKGQPSLGVRDRVYVSACVLDNGARRLAFCSAEVLGMRLYARDDLLARLPEALGLTADTLFFCGTNTISSLGGVNRPVNNFLVDRLLEQAFGVWDPAMYEHLLARCAEALIAADAAREPARLAFASAREKRFVRNDVHVNGPRDVQLQVMHAVAPDGRSLGAFFAYPLSNVLPWNDRRISGDVMGWTRAALEEALGPAAAVLYFNPAYCDAGLTELVTGDEREEEPEIVLPEQEERTSLLTYKPVEEPEFTAAQIETRVAKGRRIARALADHALRLLRRARPAEAPELAGAGNLVPMPPKEGLFAMVAPAESAFPVFQVGPALFVGLPGTATATIGLNLKAQAQRLGSEAWVVGNASDYAGNFLHPAAYTERLERYLYREKRQAAGYGATVATFIERQTLGPRGLEQSTYESGAELTLEYAPEGAQGIDKVGELAARSLGHFGQLFATSGQTLRKLAVNSRRSAEELRAERLAREAAEQAPAPAPPPVPAPPRAAPAAPPRAAPGNDEQDY